MRRGVVDFTLDTGKVPPWLFQRMVRLGRSILWALRQEFGPAETLKRLADPVWFQSFGTVLAFDWNASGLTTTTMGAVKQAVNGIEGELGIFVCGGKGKTSRKVPQELLNWSYRLGLNFQPTLETTSRLTAKIDSSLVQDGFTLYHHNFLFDTQGNWAVIQQGMNLKIQRARRYHWYGSLADSQKLKSHFSLQSKNIISQVRFRSIVDLAAPTSQNNRQISLALVHHPKNLFKDLNLLERHWQPKNKTDQLLLFESPQKEKLLILAGNQNDFSPTLLQEKFNFDDVRRRLRPLVEKQPSCFFDLLIQPGIGGKTLRAISLVAELIYGAKPSYTDPVRYSFAHGGKDGVPYPIDTFTYDRTIGIIEKAIKTSRSLSLQEKDQALKRLLERPTKIQAAAAGGRSAPSSSNSAGR